MGMLVIIKDWEVFHVKKRKKHNGGKHRQNHKGKPISVCFPSDTGR
jgi:hypothetical protein